jgi:hypothetical protein
MRRAGWGVRRAADGWNARNCGVPPGGHPAFVREVCSTLGLGSAVAAVVRCPAQGLSRPHAITSSCPARSRGTGRGGALPPKEKAAYRFLAACLSPRRRFHARSRCAPRLLRGEHRLPEPRASWRQVTITFRGSAQRVQLAWHFKRSRRPGPPGEGHMLTLTVRALPHSADPSTPFAHGEVHYSGSDGDAAWNAVRRVAPLAPLPKRLERLVTSTTLLRNCAVCGLPVHHDQSRPVLRSGSGRSRWVHGACAAKVA